MIAERVRAETRTYLNPSVAFFAPVAAAVLTPWVQPAVGGYASRLEPVVEMHNIVRQTQARAMTVSEIANNLKDAGLPISAIAEMGRVERKTVYAWLDGTAAREIHTSRMSQIHRALLPEERRDLRDLYRLWTTPLDDGSTLKSLLTAETLDAKAVSAAVAALTPKAASLAERRRRMAVPGGGANGFAKGLEVTTSR